MNYTGRDAEFSLYEDDGLSYAYEKGAHATIPLRWQEREQELTIGARRGSFEGQLPRRSFRVIFVSPETPIGFAFEQTPHATLAYEGQAVTLGLDAARRSR
jgi:alpha-D-xyloside xylohydrolase